MDKKFILLSSVATILTFCSLSESMAAKCISDGETETGGKYENSTTSCTSCGLNCDWEIVGTKLIVSPSNGATDVAVRSFGGPVIAPWRGQSVTEAEVKQGITNLGEFTFYPMRDINKISLPEGLTTIQYGAFNGTSITSIDIPESVTTMGGAVFANTSLSSITIPEGVTSLGNDVFTHTSNLNSVYLPDTIMAFGVNKNTFRDSRVRNFYCIDTNGQCSALKSLLISEGYLSGRNFYTVPAVSGCQNYNSSGCASCYSTWQQNANGSCDCNNGRHIINGKCVANTVANCNKEVSGKCTECNSGYLTNSAGTCTKTEDCKNEYFVDSESGACKPIPGCSSFSNGACTCDTGYYKKDGGCVSETTGCGDGYLGKNNECISASNGCGAGYRQFEDFCNRIQYTPAEAAEVLHDDNTNSVTITFKK